jgi:hypothetical protein
MDGAVQMKRVGGVVVLAAVVALGVGACSSGGPGALPGGISSSSCRLQWEGDDALYATYSAAYAEEVKNDGPNPPDLPDQVPQYTLTAGSTLTVGSISVAFFNKSGKEIYDDAGQFNLNQTLTAGQPYTGAQTSYVVSNLGPGDASLGTTDVASCQVVAWTPGN